MTIASRVSSVQRLALAVIVASVVATPAFADTAGVDVSSLVTLIGTGLAAVSAIGAAVLGVQGLIKLYGMVKGALARS
ncbi:major capsid protein [Aquitalea magnusonii]|uniref:major capsid protein n=1 Tax=Aquitalea magnusonii TaxID=332411 RepID=UPI0007505545|nr:major capsid protein [Aquitalea magnusonii]